MRQFKIAAALLVLASCPLAHAGVIGIPLGGSTTGVIGADGHGSFTDSLSFNISQPSNLKDTFGSLGISGFSYTLYDATTSSFVGSAKTKSFSDLPGGMYDFIFSGTVPGIVGFYAGGFRTSAAGAVPELDVWMMLIIGGALLVYQLRRRQSSLRNSQLATN